MFSSHKYLSIFMRIHSYSEVWSAAPTPKTLCNHSSNLDHDYFVSYHCGNRLLLGRNAVARIFTVFCNMPFDTEIRSTEVSRLQGCEYSIESVIFGVKAYIFSLLAPLDSNRYKWWLTRIRVYDFVSPSPCYKNIMLYRLCPQRYEYLSSIRFLSTEDDQRRVRRTDSKEDANIILISSAAVWLKSVAHDVTMKHFYQIPIRLNAAIVNSCWNELLRLALNTCSYGLDLKQEVFKNTLFKTSLKHTIE